MVGPSFPFKGGIAQYTTQLYRELQQRHNVLFCSFNRQYPDWLYPGQGDTDETDTLLQGPGQHPIIDSLNPFSWRTAARLIVDFKPDMLIFPWWVIFWTPHFFYMIRAIRRRSKTTRIIFVCHNVVAHEGGWLSKLLTRWTLQLGDAFLVHSYSEANSLKSLLDNPRYVQAEHPIYTLAQGDVRTRNEAREALGLAGNTVLFFGFVRPYKGLEVLLSAMSRVVLEMPCNLVVAGEIWGDKTKYLAQIETLGITVTTRLVDRYIPGAEVGNYFGACDIVVLPYLSATGSGVVKLAYSYGRPVIVTAVGSLADVVIPGQTGYVVEPGDADALAAKILEYLSGSDQLAMEQAIIRYRQQFGWDNVVAGLESLSNF